jgi:hypothetical protein
MHQKLNKNWIKNHKIETQKNLKILQKLKWFCTSKWFSSDVAKFEFTQIHKMWKKIIILTQKHEPNKLKTLTLPWNSLLNLIFVTSCVLRCIVDTTTTGNSLYRWGLEDMEIEMMVIVSSRYRSFTKWAHCVN